MDSQEQILNDIKFPKYKHISKLIKQMWRRWICCPALHYLAAEI